MMKDLLTMEQASGLLGISRVKLTRLINEGKIKTISLGKTRRINRREIENYIAQLDPYERVKLESRKTDDGLLTMEQAAGELGVCRRTLDVLVFSGTMPSVMIGRRRFIRREDLQRYIDREPNGTQIAASRNTARM